MSRRNGLFRHLMKANESETAAAILTASPSMSEAKAKRIARSLHNYGKPFVPPKDESGQANAA